MDIPGRCLLSIRGNDPLANALTGRNGHAETSFRGDSGSNVSIFQSQGLQQRHLEQYGSTRQDADRTLNKRMLASSARSGKRRSPG